MQELFSPWIYTITSLCLLINTRTNVESLCFKRGVVFLLIFLTRPNFPNAPCVHAIHFPFLQHFEIECQLEGSSSLTVGDAGLAVVAVSASALVRSENFSSFFHSALPFASRMKFMSGVMRLFAASRASTDSSPGSPEVRKRAISSDEFRRTSSTIPSAQFRHGPYRHIL